MITEPFVTFTPSSSSFEPDFAGVGGGGNSSSFLIPLIPCENPSKSFTDPFKFPVPFVPSTFSETDSPSERNCTALSVPLPVIGGGGEWLESGLVGFGMGGTGFGDDGKLPGSALGRGDLTSTGPGDEVTDTTTGLGLGLKLVTPGILFSFSGTDGTGGVFGGCGGG